MNTQYNFCNLVYRSLKLHRIALVGVIIVSTTACSDLLSTPAIPDGTQSPTTYHSRQGAFALARGAASLFSSSLMKVSVRSGLITDELSSSTGNSEMNDIRELPESFSGRSDASERDEYQELHKLRGQARLARALLTEYAPDEPELRGQLFAFEGYAVIMLADLFCSGVPLSTLEFNEDYTYRPPSTSEEMYLHAITLFDSTIAIVSDSANLLTLARVGKGRALVALGRYDEAASAVSEVEDSEVYRTRITFLMNPKSPSPSNRLARYATVSDREGENGLPYLSSGDPRTASDPVSIQVQSSQRTVNFPNKYLPNDSTWFRVASGIEARLIEAEAALNGEEYGRWIQMLNRLRTSETYSEIDTLESGEIDTVWNAGTGGIEGLGPLTDPGNAEARIKLMFSERAAWLFMEAQRQGDMRRLVRVYAMDRESVYPTGRYSNGNSVTGFYGGDITVPIPPEEQRNPHFNGCLNRD